MSEAAEGTLYELFFKNKQKTCVLGTFTLRLCVPSHTQVHMSETAAGALYELIFCNKEET
jgi:hypothetical protein